MPSTCYAWLVTITIALLLFIFIIIVPIIIIFSPTTPLAFWPEDSDVSWQEMALRLDWKNQKAPGRRALLAWAQPGQRHRVGQVPWEQRAGASPPEGGVTSSGGGESVFGSARPSQPVSHQGAGRGCCGSLWPGGRV